MEQLVRFFRTLFLICLSVALSVQFSAEVAAKARQEMPTMETTNSGETLQSASEVESIDGLCPEDCGKCCDMAQDCLVAVNCMTSIALIGTLPVSQSMHLDKAIYLVGLVHWLKGLPISPESPPPQLKFKA